MVILPNDRISLPDALRLLVADETTSLCAECRALDDPERAGAVVLGFYWGTMVPALASGELPSHGMIVGPNGETELFEIVPIPPAAWRSGFNAGEALREQASPIAALFDPHAPKYAASTVFLRSIEYLPLFRAEDLLAWAKSLRRELAADASPLRAGENVEEPVTTYRTGVAGRPTSSHLIASELARRQRADEAHPILKDEAEYLEGWLKTTHPKATPMKSASIRNSVRAQFGRHKVRSTK